MTNEIEIGEAGSGDKTAWADYIARRNEASIFHDLAWAETVEGAYGWRAVNLTARRGGKIVGVLPLTDVKSRLFGRSLISSAFAVGGGALADDDAALAALGDRAFDIGAERGVNYVELRGGPAPDARWREKAGLYASFARAMPDKAEDLIAWLPKNRRAQIKKAMRIESVSGASLRLDGRPEEFLPLYAEALRNLGTPAPSLKFVRLLKEKFGDAAEISLLMKDGAPIATLLTFWRRDRVLPYYIGGSSAARDLFAYDYLYFSLMKRAVEKGVRQFDFGRSKIGSTHYDTKTYWGFAATPLVYHVGLVRAKTLPNVSGANPKFAALSAAWKRLPLPIANVAGPILARHLA